MATLRPQIASVALLSIWLLAPASHAEATEAARLAGTLAPPVDGLEFFEKRIRPLLTERCYECHSAGKKQKGGLRLDTREGWSKGGDTGPALVPGEPEKSLLIKAVRYSDPDLQMPPKKRLDPAQLSDLEKWVKMGAPDPRVEAALASKLSGMSLEEGRKFWAYQWPTKPKTPSVRDGAWPRTGIDLFILEKLEKRDLQPAPDAAREELVRRAYFDLIGLPPRPEEIDEFLNGSSPEAYPRLVDRLLASSHFGEHWARHWFDVARFAQSVVLRGLVFKEAWRYRDYVIGVFNNDVPFDRFVKEQIAGDLLPHRDIDEHQRRLIATTFLAMGNSNLEEQDKKQLDMDVVDEQLDTIGKAFLGQTIGCARCHDHKFDPIPTRDYYAMAGILRNVRTLNHANVSSWIEVPLPLPPAEEQVFARHEKQFAELQAEIKAARDAAKALAGKTAEPKGSATKASVIAARELPGIVADSAQAKAVGEWKLSQYSKHYIGDGYWHDNNAGKGEKTLTFVPDIPRPGRYEVRFAYIHAPSRASEVPITVFHADGETTVTVNEQEPPAIDGRFVSLGNFRFEANGFGYVLVSNEKTKGYVTADAVQLVPAEALEGQSTKLATTSSETRSPKTSANDANKRIKVLEEKLKKLTDSGPTRPKVMSVIEQQKIEDAPIHIRGTVHNLGPVVPRGFLSVVGRLEGFNDATAQGFNGSTLPANQSGRREFAEWIVHPENPLTARVFVNRVWNWLMGEGLVRTPDNFGTTGERPSHPELLDYLAMKFVEQGWSAKSLVREIMLSRVYQLSTVGSSNSRDPENRLFGRANHRRLTAECLRDAMLLISGELDFATRGPNLPANLTADYGYQFTNRCRSVYVPLFRNVQPEIFEAFDLPSPSMVTGRRTVSTVPTQALFVMNSPFVQERAEAAARRLLTQGGADDRALLDRAYRMALGRLPTAQERTLALKFLDGHVTNLPTPHPVRGEGATSPGSAQDVAALVQRWTEVFHVLFGCLDFRYLK